MDKADELKAGISATNPSKSTAPISVRIRKNKGPDPVRVQLHRIGQSEYVESYDEGDFVRFAIEFTARCLDSADSLPRSEYDQLSDDTFKEILEKARAAMAAKSAPVNGTRSISPIVESAIEPSSINPVGADAAATRRDHIIPSRNYDYSTILRDSQELWLVFNDMYNWLGNHSHQRVLEDRIRSNKLKTNIFLIHPESPALNYVAAKSNKLHTVARTGDNRQLYDIKRSLFRLLENVIDNAGDKTRVIGHQWVHAYSMVMNETEAYVTQYLNKKVGNDGIIHIYRTEQSSGTAYVYKDLKDDLEDMVRYTTDLPSLNLIKYMQEHSEFMKAELYEE